MPAGVRRTSSIESMYSVYFSLFRYVLHYCFTLNSNNTYTFLMLTITILKYNSVFSGISTIEPIYFADSLPDTDQLTLGNASIIFVFAFTSIMFI